MASLRQTGDIRSYAAKFDEWVGKLQGVHRPTDFDLIHDFVRGLRDELKTQCAYNVSAGTPWVSFQACKDHALRNGVLFEATSAEYKSSRGGGSFDRGGGSRKVSSPRGGNSKRGNGASGGGASKKSKGSSSEKDRSKGFKGPSLTQEARVALMKEGKCFNCKQSGHLARDCPSLAGSSGGAKSSGKAKN